MAEGERVKGAPGRISPQDPVGDLDEAAELWSDLEGEPAAAEETATLRERVDAWSDRNAFQALSAAAASIAGNLDFPSLVRQILDSAMRMLGADRGLLFYGEGSDFSLVPLVARSGVGEDLPELEAISRSLMERIREGQAVQSEDAQADPRYRDIPSVSLAKIRSVLGVPLTIRGQLRGALYVDNRSVASAFPDSSRLFLEAFAGLAAVALENAELHGDTLRENRRLRSRLDPREAFGRIVTVSPLMEAVLRRAALVAQSDAPVMILGESGTGKELMARAIHEASPRSRHAFVAHNCAAVPGQLMESIFFGHTRGAFTGAIRDSRGLFRLADRGSLFLDEVAELDAALQAKLLRVLEDGRIRPVGAEREQAVDVRLITATSRDLETAIREGQFREELFYRTNVLELRLPPLRDRIDDIPILVEQFIERYADRPAGRVRFTPDALEFLQSLPWRGNVRELGNLVQRVLVLCPGPEVGLDQVRRLLPMPAESPGANSRTAVAGAGENASGTPGTAAVEAESEPPEAGPASPRERETVSILEALRKSKGNKSEAARRLGMHRNAFLRRMKRLGIDMDTRY